MEVGFIKSINHFLIRLEGLPSAKINDLIKAEDGTSGWVIGLNSDSVDALVLTENTIKPGQRFELSNKSLTVNIGNHLLGRVINPIGLPLDGKGMLASKTGSQEEMVDKQAPRIFEREFITRQMITGLTMIDMLIPIGLGQRELILGDSRSGKTSFLTTLVTNQKNSGIIVIYATIGKPATEVRNIIDVLKINGALEYTTIIASSSSDPPPLIYITPQTALTLAEFYQKQGKDVLVVLDDMGIHAKIYREISLLSDIIPGRESYPGDIFYQHSHLLERGGKFTQQAGGGSITVLPVIEINLNDFTTYVPTNLMAMTDGHLMFKSSTFNQGKKPAIDIPLSVSRVGLQTQILAQKQLGFRIKALLAQASQLQTLSHFSSELPPQTQLIARQASIIEELIHQEILTFIPKETQMILLALTFTNFYLKKGLEFVKLNKQKLATTLSTDQTLLKTVKESQKVRNEEELIRLAESLVPALERIFK